MNKELLDKINAAVEADQIAFKKAAENLNLTLNEGAISGRRQGYFKGYSDAIGEIEKGREAIDILKALCALKKHKDTEGKDWYYESAQPEVWKIANKFLEKLNL